MSEQKNIEMNLNEVKRYLSVLFTAFDEAEGCRTCRESCNDLYRNYYMLIMKKISEIEKSLEGLGEEEKEEEVEVVKEEKQEDKKEKEKEQEEQEDKKEKEEVKEEEKQEEKEEVREEKKEEDKEEDKEEEVKEEKQEDKQEDKQEKEEEQEEKQEDKKEDKQEEKQEVREEKEDKEEKQEEIKQESKDMKEVKEKKEEVREEKQDVEDVEEKEEKEEKREEKQEEIKDKSQDMKKVKEEKQEHESSFKEYRGLESIYISSNEYQEVVTNTSVRFKNGAVPSNRVGGFNFKNQTNLFIENEGLYSAEFFVIPEVENAKLALFLNNVEIPYTRYKSDKKNTTLSGNVIFECESDNCKLQLRNVANTTLKIGDEEETDTVTVAMVVKKIG